MRDHRVRSVAGLTVAMLLAAASVVAAADAVTFNRDIAPILFTHCASCHRPGEVGPFSLLTYRDARQHLSQIVDATSRRVMPPWKPAPGPHPLIGDRSLTDEQILRIKAWAGSGAAEGEARDLPPLPKFDSGWQLGTPDLVVTMDRAYMLSAEPGDVFRTFVIPIPTTTTRYVRAIEFRPGNARVVHHANIGVDRTRSSRKLDDADPEVGYVGGMVPDAGYPPGYMLGWTPGQRPRPSPEGMAWRLEPGSDFVVQLHLQPTGKLEPVQVSAGLYFTDEAPVASPVGLRLGSETMEIPAGAAGYEITDSYALPVDVDLLAIQPHAHNLGRVMEAFATRPDGQKESLLSISDWDFRWQDVYRYERPIALPKGTIVSMRFVYDNSAANPRNPVRPPQRVLWGQNTTDEMGDLWLQLVPRDRAEFGALVSDVNRKTRAEDIAAYTKIMKAEPLNPLRHDVVAMLHLQAGRPAVAVAEFRESLRLNPASAPTHYNLGLALSLMRDYRAALAEFEEAVRLSPDYAEAHNNLGAMRHVFGQLDAAAGSYRRAFELNPDNIDARNNLGRLLIQQGKPAEAAPVFEEALRRAPNAAGPQSGLAWVLATTPDPALKDAARAVVLAEAAVAASGGDAAMLDTLATARAAAGDFDGALRDADAALAAADRQNAQALWVEIRSRRQLFERRLPYVAK